MEFLLHAEDMLSFGRGLQILHGDIRGHDDFNWCTQQGHKHCLVRGQGAGTQQGPVQEREDAVTRQYHRVRQRSGSCPKQTIAHHTGIGAQIAMRFQRADARDDGLENIGSGIALFGRGIGFAFARFKQSRIFATAADRIDLRQ